MARGTLEPLGAAGAGGTALAGVAPARCAGGRSHAGARAGQPARLPPAFLLPLCVCFRYIFCSVQEMLPIIVFFCPEQCIYFIMSISEK